MDIFVTSELYWEVKDYEMIDNFDPRSLCREAWEYLRDTQGRSDLECERDYKVLVRKCGLTH